MPIHLKLTHPGSTLSRDLVQAITITRDEEDYLKVPHIPVSELLENGGGIGTEGRAKGNNRS